MEDGPSTLPTGDTKPRLRVLSDGQAQAIHAASLQVLERTGYYVPVAGARDLLQAGGARVQGDRVYITQGMVEQALKTIRPVTIYDRAGLPALPLGQGRVTCGVLADTIFVHDPYQRANRPYVRDDQTWFASVLDALPNVDWIMCVGQAMDVPNALQTQTAVLETVRRSEKPIWALPYDRAGLLDILDLYSVIAGSSAALRERPRLMCASVPAAPLYGTRENIEVLLTCAETETPMVTYSCPALGGNSPCSVAGTLALTNADWLANVVLHQLKRPGAPLCSAGFTVQVMDMKSTLWSYCAPEVFLAYAAVTDLAHWYGMPAWGLEMCTDSPELDAQAGAEMMTEFLWAMLSGVEMVHNAGIRGSGKVCSAEGVILADEIMAYAKAMMTPPALNEAQLAAGVDVIGEVGALGEYVSHPHTLAHFRDLWYPQLFDRNMFDPMQKKLGPDLVDRLNARARQLIETHTPAHIPDGELAELDRLEAGWHRREGVV